MRPRITSSTKLIKNRNKTFPFSVWEGPRAPSSHFRVNFPYCTELPGTWFLPEVSETSDPPTGRVSTSHHLSPFWDREAPEPRLPAPTLFAETKSSASSQDQAAQGGVTWSHPPGEARPMMCKSPRAEGVTMPGQAFSNLLDAAALSDPSAPPGGNHVNNWRKPRPPRSYFFFPCVFFVF